MAASAPARLLLPRVEFPFPHAPYAIQRALMSNIYTAMKKKRVGIFESPTGTVSGREWVQREPRADTSFCRARR
jgi:hypothetical protein